ncbi:hypothetical protein MXB_4254 [Myxobolus squamalis]|nr:hypothetical protein MXB_4254 [Myxobolus squamalis]
MLTECKYVRVPLMLEQVRSMVSEMPSAEFLFFYEIILETVRDHIAEACGFAYESMPTPSLIKMLNLADNLEYFNQLSIRHKWSVSEALTVFPRSQSSFISEDARTVRKIDQLIKLSMDLETIV